MEEKLYKELVKAVKEGRVSNFVEDNYNSLSKQEFMCLVKEFVYTMESLVTNQIGLDTKSINKELLENLDTQFNY